MTILQILLINLAALLTLFLALWLISLARHNVNIVDVFWGLGFVLVGWLTVVTSGSLAWHAWVISLLVTLWGFRLAGYLTWRNWGKPEDSRYAEMRDKHGKKFPLISLFTVFGLQAVLAWIISWPVQIGIANAPSGDVAWQYWLVGLGSALWLTGLIFEAVGDDQLARFKANPENRGQVMNRGLWRYTRHPNYFGDFLVWWGLFLVTARPDSWWWTIIGPLLMSFLLIRVSGVRLLESSLKSRVAGYEEYVRNTSAFIPMPPRHHS